MSTSTLITDWMGSGTAAAKPSSPPIASSGVAFYYATDTTTLYMWDTNASTWKQISLGGGGSGSGLFGQVLSTTPTQSSTGLSTWANQGTATTSNVSTGLQIHDTTQSSDEWRLLYKTAPSTPYSFSALISQTSLLTQYMQVALGWYDGTKLHVLSVEGNATGVAPATPAIIIGVQRITNVTTFGSTDFQMSCGTPMIWVKLYDDGTNVNFYISYDGCSWLKVYSVAKASGWLSSYSNVCFAINANNNHSVSPGDVYGTIMSWTQGTS